MDTVTVYVSHIKINMVFRRTTVVNLIITYLRRTVMPKRLTKPKLFADMKHDLQDVDIIVTIID